MKSLRRRISVACGVCGKQIEKSSANRARYEKGAIPCCSYECRAIRRCQFPMRSMVGPLNPQWKGGISKEHYRYRKTQLQRYPDRCAARRKVHEAVKAGRLVRQPCEVCGVANSHAHHEDYSKPLEVRWFCQKHHNALHPHSRPKEVTAQ